ncbi:MAG: hypothetical protein C0598_00850 [Marinilabiliales bacterium]|nr:MAG: hypothetical protein C0598_00850 [Marinilabiliales bacterium]
MLELNEKGFLNGHTPFSALLAFVNVLLSCVNGVGNIALSNENSANESTVPGTKINHQYSKSFEFENDFNYYIHNYVHPELKYFSFLRPLNEMQIAFLFSKYHWHFESFRSCNVGSKNDEWCGSCPKCLFTYLILSPFIKKKTLDNIFKKDLLNDQDLTGILLELSGVSEVKPFECVGTIKEVQSAVNNLKSNESYTLGKSILLNLNDNQIDKNIGIKELLSEFNNHNNLPESFLRIIKKAIDD